MAEPVTVEIGAPIASVGPIDDGGGAAGSVAEAVQARETAEVQKGELMLACRSLESAATRLEQFQEEIFSSHKEQIARLSVEIAGKILRKEIGEGKYDIVKIIEEALKVSPAQQDVVVRLNPADLACFEKGVDKKGDDVLSNVKLIPDAGIGRGECVVETDKGMIEYFIEEHLKKVSEALKITE